MYATTLKYLKPVALSQAMLRIHHLRAEFCYVLFKSICRLTTLFRGVIRMPFYSYEKYNIVIFITFKLSVSINWFKLKLPHKPVVSKVLYRTLWITIWSSHPVLLCSRNKVKKGYFYTISVVESNNFSNFRDKTLNFSSPFLFVGADCLLCSASESSSSRCAPALPPPSTTKLTKPSP